MSKQAHLADGTILEFPDETSAAVMDSAVRKHILTERQTASKAAFDANQPESHLGMNMSLGTLWDELKQRTGTFLNGAQPGQPGYSPSTGAANMLGGIAPGGPETEGMGLAQALAHSPAANQIRDIGNLVTSPESLLARATANHQAVPSSNDLLSAVSPKARLVQALTKPYRAVAAPVQDALAHFLSNGMPVGPEIAADEASRLAQAVASNPPEYNPDFWKGATSGNTGTSITEPSPINKRLIEALRAGTVTPEQQAGMEQAWSNRGSGVGSPAIPTAAQASEPTMYRPAPDTGLPSMTPPRTAADINKWMNVTTKQMVHGANPGEQILSDGLMGPTKEATLENVQKALDGVGTQMSSVLQDAGKQGVRINAESAVEDAMVNATKTIGKRTDAGFQTALSNILDDILHKHPDLQSMEPDAAHAFKKEIGDAVTWGKGTAYENDINQVLREIYSKLNTTIKDKVTNMGDLQSQWGNLYQGVKALKMSLLKDAIGRGTGAIPK